ncbi:MAG: virginiamycin lyase [Frankiaceae bacterium]|jgi:DNA-binding beta-propeller fold protein YncE|nr:virginiamycin lyase [Frankiaceae bacterium]
MRRTALLALLVFSCGTSAAPAAPATSPAAPSSLAPFALGLPSTVVEKVTTGGEPCGVVAAAGSVWVTDAEGARLLRIRGGRVVATTKVDATPCELTYGYGSLWVATQSGRLDRVDPKTGRVLARIAVGETSYEPVVAFGFVWVTNRNSATVSKIDPARNRVVATVSTPFVNAGGIVAAAGWLWIGNDSSNDTTFLRMNPRTSAIARLTAGPLPAFVAAAGGSVWTANQGDGTVSRVDERTGKALATLVAGVSPVNLAALPVASPEVWVPDDKANLLIRIDAGTGTVIERMLAGSGPAVVAPDGTDVWVTNFGDGTVWRVRPGPR